MVPAARDGSSRPALRRAAASLLAACFAVYAAYRSPLAPQVVSAASTPPESYAEARVSQAFAGIPIEEVRAALDARLPAGVPVALDASIRRSVRWHPRLVEGLYPRRVDQNAAHVLSMTSAPVAESSSVIATIGTVRLTLSGPATGIATGNAPRFEEEAPASPSQATGRRTRLAERLDLSWACFAACLAGVAGWGALAWLLLTKLARARGLDPAPPTASVLLLLASVVFAVAVSAATWLEIPIAWSVVTIAGTVLAAASAVIGLRRGGLRSIATFFPAEDLLVALFAVLLLFELSRYPVTDADGRSIWLFHAKEVFASGFFARDDLLHPDLRWTHPGYPLLLPAWLAQFTSLEGAYDERMAILGIPVLAAAVAGSVGAMLRSSIGRAASALAALALFLGTESFASSAQADGFLCLYLVAGLVGLGSSRFEPVGWAALAGASLTKQEGLVFAALVAVAFVAFHPRARERAWPRRLVPCVALLPAALHEAWVHWIGIVGAYSEIAWSEVPAHAPRRFAVVMGAIPAMLGRRPALWSGAIGLAASLPFVFRSRAGWKGRAAIAAGFLFLAFVVAVLVVSPFRIGWHVETALGRLLVHPATFFAMAPLLLLGDAEERRSEPLPAPAAGTEP